MTEYWKNDASREDLLVALEKMKKEVIGLYEENCRLKDAVNHNERLVKEEQMKNIAYRNEGEANALKWFIRFFFSEQLAERREE